MIAKIGLLYLVHAFRGRNKTLSECPQLGRQLRAAMREFATAPQVVR